jgi:two-component system, OmpR family, alkaline phosphatase synthesis response regulator PhoP
MKAVFIGVDTEVASFTTTSLHLRWPDCTLLAADTPDQGLDLVEAHSPEVVLLHATAGQGTVRTVQDLRRFSAVPLLVLSAQPDQLQLITVLERGADDYIRLPCGLPEFMARVLAVLRRAGAQRFDQPEGTIVLGDLLINPASYEAFIGNHRLKLTVTEFRLLHTLARNHGRVVPHHTLEVTLWGDRWNGNVLVKKYVQRLRNKLAVNNPGKSYISSVHGIGYRFIGTNPPPLGPASGGVNGQDPRAFGGSPEANPSEAMAS